MRILQKFVDKGNTSESVGGISRGGGVAKRGGHQQSQCIMHGTSDADRTTPQLESRTQCPQTLFSVVKAHRALPFVQEQAQRD